jgi:phage terminase large subunit GpA-like protein
VTDLNVQLLPWQQEVYSDSVRFKVVAAGRRTGKSRLAAWMLIINALQADKGHVFYVAPTQGQARDIMWQTLLELGHPVIAGSHINNLQIRLVNGATISLKGADRPETMRGVSLKFLVMDEYADMKPDVWEQILRPALADQKGQALFIGTPMGRNHFYELYKYAMTPTKHGTLQATTIRYWTLVKSTSQKNLCQVMRFVKNLWRRLKLVVRKCLRKVGFSSVKNRT